MANALRNNKGVDGAELVVIDCDARTPTDLSRNSPRCVPDEHGFGK
jgi:hypothetical protein